MGRLSKIDPSSYSEPERIITKHSAFKWTVDFANTKLLGSVTHKFNVLEANLPAIVSVSLFYFYFFKLDVTFVFSLYAVVRCT